MTKPSNVDQQRSSLNFQGHIFLHMLNINCIVIRSLNTLNDSVIEYVCKVG